MVFKPRPHKTPSDLFLHSVVREPFASQRRYIILLIAYYVASVYFTLSFLLSAELFSQKYGHSVPMHLLIVE